MRLKVLFLILMINTSVFALDGVKSITVSGDDTNYAESSSYLIVQENASSTLMKAYNDYNSQKITVDELVVITDEIKDKGENDRLRIGVSDENCGWDCINGVLIDIDKISEKKLDYVEITSAIVKNPGENPSYVYTLTVNQSEEKSINIDGEISLIGGITDKGYEEIRRDYDNEILDDFLVSDSSITRTMSQSTQR